MPGPFRSFAIFRKLLIRLAGIYLVGLLLLTVLGLISRWLTIYYLLISSWTLLLYWRDKSAAARGDFRISERCLHLFALAGGWPGAVAGQQYFRHKTRKSGFQQSCWLALLLHTSLLVSFQLSR